MPLGGEVRHGRKPNERRLKVYFPLELEVGCGMWPLFVVLFSCLKGFLASMRVIVGVIHFWLAASSPNDLISILVLNLTCQALGLGSVLFQI